MLSFLLGTWNGGRLSTGLEACLVSLSDTWQGKSLSYFWPGGLVLGEEMGKIVLGTSAFLESLMACTSAYHELWEWVERDI